MAKLKINFTGFEEGKLYKRKNDSITNNIRPLDCVFKIIKGDLCFEYPNQDTQGKITLDSWDLKELLKAEFEEAKTKLTDTQIKVLEGRLLEGYEWIAKEENGEVYVYGGKPTRGTGCWQYGSWQYSFCKANFDFLSWEDAEPTNIKELLEEE